MEDLPLYEPKSAPNPIADPEAAFAVLGGVDVCFVIDVTGSMGGWLHAAQGMAEKTVAKIAADGELDIRAAIVAYRDHPPQDSSFVTKVFDFGGLDVFGANLASLTPAGGGDGPEAVFDGLVDAGTKLQWRPTADKLCFLIGDSPPHGAGERGDYWPSGCPCHATAAGIVEIFGSQHIKLSATSIAGNPITTSAFRELTNALRGETEEASAEAAYGGVTFSRESTTVSYLSASSSMVGASRAYTASARKLSASGMAPSAANLASDLGWTPDMVSGTASYLNARNLSVDDAGNLVVVNESEVPKPNRRARRSKPENGK